jgi:hypothetical protein
MEEYVVLQDRQRRDNLPAGQEGFERQLSELRLDSSERSAEADRSLQRADVGGSMRMPLSFNQWNNWSRDTRRSVDLPRACASTWGASEADLQDRLFSSTRYTAPSEPQPMAHTKESKSRGLWSRVKSGVGKALGGQKLPGGSAFDMVTSELRMDFAKRGRETAPYVEDEELISRFRRVGDGTESDRTFQRNASYLSNFSAWLNARGRPPMVDRLNGPDLDMDVLAYEQAEDPADSNTSWLASPRR